MSAQVVDDSTGEFKRFKRFDSTAGNWQDPSKTQRLWRDYARFRAVRDRRRRLQTGWAGSTTIRVTKDGFEPEVRTVMVQQSMASDFGLGYVWPSILSEQMSKLPLPSNMRLKRMPGSGPSYYSAVYSVVVYVSPAPVGGEIGAISHEICHGHQEKLVREAGGGSNLIPAYYETAEGKDFIQSTGWRQENGQWVHYPVDGWRGYPNPVEDSAQTCATYYNPSGFLQPLHLSSPARQAWAARWLPR